MVPAARGSFGDGRGSTGVAAGVSACRKNRRLRAATWCALSAIAIAATAAEPARTTPSRPGAPSSSAQSSSVPTTKFGRIDYVAAAEIAKRLSLKLTWIQAGRKLTLTGPSVRAELERDTRDIVVNGLRIFLGDPIVDARGELYVSRIDFERALTPMLRPGHGVADPGPTKVVVLDPGHGGKDNGTSVHEKTYALDVAKRAKKTLELAGYRVVLTRDDDTFLELNERSAIANAAKADLFVSLHFNALKNNTKTSGFEIYTFPPANQRSTKSWSPMEDNDAESEPSPANRFDHWNVALAHAIHHRFVADLKTFDRGKKLYHLGVLRGLKCPGVLVECGFLTSEVESRKIATPAYRQKIAEAVVAGIRDYAATAGGAAPKSGGVAKKPQAATARR